MERGAVLTMAHSEAGSTKSIRINEPSIVSVLPGTADSVSTDSGISSAISEEEGDNGNGAKDSDVSETVEKTEKSEKTEEPKEPKEKDVQVLKLERPKLYNSKVKSSFEEIKRIALLIEKSVRQKRVFCLGGAHFPSAKKALIKRGWIEVSAKSRSAIGKHAKLLPYRTSTSVTTGNIHLTGSTMMRVEEFASDINIQLLKENVEIFMKKESNFKRPPKPDVIYAKLTKNFLPNYEWCGHRRRIPWKHLLKDQMVNKFPSSFFTTKTGLHQSLQQLHWYSPQPVATFFPRCHQVRQHPTFSIALKLLNVRCLTMKKDRHSLTIIE